MSDSTMVRLLLLACAPALINADCTASDICTTSSDYDSTATGSNMCCEDTGCATLRAYTISLL